MRNKFLFLSVFFFIFLNYSFASSNDNFDFNITEIEITNNGNFFKGFKRGIIETNNGETIITADTFEYDKITNILKVNGNVILENRIKNYLIKSNQITYFKQNEKIFSKGKTEAIVDSNYKVSSNDVNLDLNQNILTSENKTTIVDNEFTKYETDILDYSIEKNIFKGINIKISTNINKSENEKSYYYFKDGIFDLELKEFLASETKIYVEKNIFAKNENDPRIFGKSSQKSGDITKINKAIFTSCAQADSCPPWSIKAKSITHNNKKKDIIYDKPILRLFDFPIIYLPKFTHPDPTVSRRSGFLQPKLGSSNILGSSVSLPYFYTLSENTDLTFNPTVFDQDIYMYRGEFRQTKENSNLIADFGLTTGYDKSIGDTKKNSIGHIFAKYKSEININNFKSSTLDVVVQKTNKDTFLKVFENNLSDINKNLKPDQNKLNSSIILDLNHDEFNLDGGFLAYETLSGSNNDRYQYVLPYYNFSRNILSNSLINLDFYSNGENNLSETNKLKSSINNNFIVNSIDFFSNNGFKNKFDINLKNFNSVAKNNVKNYQSSPQIELRGLLNLESSLPLNKSTNKFLDTLTPKISLRTNPNEMKTYSTTERTINTKNIFNINRLGLFDTLEQGTSVTMGLNYKKQSIQNINKFIEMNLSGITRDVAQNKIPYSSGISQKTSNLFGSVNYNLSENINFNYDFSLDNDLNTFERNTIGGSLVFDKFSTSLNFTESNGKLGNTNILENSFKYDFNKKNSLIYNTRRNREIDLTEYYNLVYEYKNDCLVAGLKYKKSYYQDRDLKPAEDLLFTISFFPLTQYEQKIDESVYRD
jgi:LPS-assembly protein